jgi:hypothetical protein
MALLPESLSKDVQANLERVRKAAENIAAPPGPGEAAAHKVKATISCGYPPLNRPSATNACDIGADSISSHIVKIFGQPARPPDQQ